MLHCGWSSLGLRCPCLLTSRGGYLLQPRSSELNLVTRESAKFHLANGRVQEAANMLEELRKADPHDPKILAQLISAYSAFDPKKAKQYPWSRGGGTSGWLRELGVFVKCRNLPLRNFLRHSLVVLRISLSVWLLGFSSHTSLWVPSQRAKSVVMNVAQFEKKHCMSREH